MKLTTSSHYTITDGIGGTRYEMSLPWILIWKQADNIFLTNRYYHSNDVIYVEGEVANRTLTYEYELFFLCLTATSKKYSY